MYKCHIIVSCKIAWVAVEINTQSRSSNLFTFHNWHYRFNTYIINDTNRHSSLHAKRHNAEPITKHTPGSPNIEYPYYQYNIVANNAEWMNKWSVTQKDKQFFLLRRIQIFVIPLPSPFGIEPGTRTGRYANRKGDK